MPPSTLSTLYRHFFDDLPNFDTHQLFVGSDFNLVLELILDRSFLDRFKIALLWRFMHQNNLKCSFFPSVHYTFPRLDCISIRAWALKAVQGPIEFARVFWGLNTTCARTPLKLKELLFVEINWKLIKLRTHISPGENLHSKVWAVGGQNCSPFAYFH